MEGEPAPLSEQAIERALDALRRVVRERSLKVSKGRETIARAAVTYPGHFTVDDLLQSLRAAGAKRAHAATVYRALPLLIDAGLVQPALTAGESGQRYEAAFERERHDHLVCESCGKVVEFQSDALAALKRVIAAEHGFELPNQVNELRGQCWSCRETSTKSIGLT